MEDDHKILSLVIRGTYSQLILRRTPLGPAVSVHLREMSILSQIKGVKKGRDQL